jgi:hypothetical protein
MRRAACRNEVCRYTTLEDVVKSTSLVTSVRNQALFGAEGAGSGDDTAKADSGVIGMVR